MLLNIGLGLGAFSILGIVIASIIIIPRLTVPSNDTRTALQIQLDTLILDIRDYEEKLPPSPFIPTYDNSDEEAEAEATRIWKEWADPIWAEYYNKFSGRISSNFE